MTDTEGTGDWIKWEGGECPVKPGTLGKVRLRDGHETRETILSHWRWTQGHDAADIIAYRVVQP